FLPQPYNDYETTGRVDWQATDKDRVFGRYLFQQTINSNATGDFASGYVVDVPARSQQIALDWTHTFTSNFVNQGRFSFSPPNGFLPTSNGSFTFATFNGFLQNTTANGGFSLTDGPFNFPFKEQDAAIYFQDDWRIKDNLTLNLGTRWEFYGQAINLLHDLTVAKQKSSSPFWDPNLPQSLTTVPSVPQDLNNFGPNVGFAWTPRVWQGLFGQDKTVIRGGF